jgi:TrmH family RNA methyltransferase
MPEPNTPIADSAHQIRHIQKLQTERRYRDSQQSFFVEGIRGVVEAVEADWPIQSFLYSDRLTTASIARRLIREKRDQGTPCIDLTPEEFRQFSTTERASGVAAIVGQRWGRLHKLSPRAGLCWVALSMIRSPGNLGTLIRTSEAVGAAGFIILGPDVDPFHPTTVRASMGAVFRQQFVRTNWHSMLNWVHKHGCQVVGVSPDGEVEYHHFRFARSPVLFLGEERQGLSLGQRRMCRHSVRIPMAGRADSLNVAVAGSLMLYEVYRSRHCVLKRRMT